MLSKTLRKHHLSLRKNLFSLRHQPKTGLKASYRLQKIITFHENQLAWKNKPRARIRADNEFKNDISRTRKTAQQGCVTVLTRFHYRECESFRGELQRENIVTLSDVNKLIAESIQTKISSSAKCCLHCKIWKIKSCLEVHMSIS